MEETCNKLNISISTLIILKSMLLTLSVNEKTMKKAAESGYLIALDIAEKLVQKEIPFRTAHKISGMIVQTAYKSKKSISKLSASEIKASIKEIKVDPKLVSEIIKNTSITSSLNDRSSVGSAGFDEQKRMIKDRIKMINEYRIRITKQDNEISNSFENLSTKVKEIIK